MDYIRFIADAIWGIIGFLGVMNFFVGNGKRGSITASFPLLCSCGSYFYTVKCMVLNRLYASGLSIAVFLAIFFIMTSILFKDKIEEELKHEEGK